MRVLIFERNLLWSSKLTQTLNGLGHRPAVATSPPTKEGQAELAIVNLGDPGVEMLIQDLQRLGVKVIAHAGHKDKELLAIGGQSGADKVVTNGQLTFKLEEFIESLFPQKERGAPAPP